MTTAIIITVLVLFAVATVKSYAKKLTSGCCGAGGGKEEKVTAADTDTANYQYCANVKIGGMHCQRCAERIESTFNRREGFYAIADFGDGTAKIYAKKRLTDFDVRSVIVGLDYSVESIEIAENGLKQDRN
jgi:copper chaperone CopZ